jgi:hypothetical protein
MASPHNPTVFTRNLNVIFSFPTSILLFICDAVIIYSCASFNLAMLLISDKLIFLFFGVSSSVSDFELIE